MRKLVEFQVLDCNANHYGIDLSDLMDNAGRSIADYISNNYNLDKSFNFKYAESFLENDLVEIELP